MQQPPVPRCTAHVCHPGCGIRCFMPLSYNICSIHIYYTTIVFAVLHPHTPPLIVQLCTAQPRPAPPPLPLQASLRTWVLPNAIVMGVLLLLDGGLTLLEYGRGIRGVRPGSASQGGGHAEVGENGENGVTASHQALVEEDGENGAKLSSI